MLKLVPFSPVWVSHDKIDIHAIYRRPRFVEDEYGELAREYDAKTGLPTWDLTTPLPLRQHNKWEAKGFKYITLASREALFVAAKFGTLPAGTTAADYDQHQVTGPWNRKKYDEGIAEETTREADQLRADVEEFGSAVVERIRRGIEPTFKLPEHLRGVAAPGAAKAAPAEKKAKETAA